MIVCLCIHASLRKWRSRNYTGQPTPSVARSSLWQWQSRAECNTITGLLITPHPDRMRLLASAQGSARQQHIPLPIDGKRHLSPVRFPLYRAGKLGQRVSNPARASASAA